MSTRRTPPPDENDPWETDDTVVMRQQTRARPAWDVIAYQKVWLAMRSRPWTSLAVLAAGEGGQSLELADLLARLARYYEDMLVRVVDLRDTSLRSMADDLEAIDRSAEYAIVALRSIGENPASAAIAQHSGAAVLCVELGRSRVEASRRAIQAIGKEKFMGTVVFDPNLRPLDK